MRHNIRGMSAETAISHRFALRCALNSLPTRKVPVTGVSRKVSLSCHRVALAFAPGEGRSEDDATMQLQSDLATPACPYCGDRLLAPEVSEFVDGGEIRHHWSCDSCGGESRTSIELTAH